MTRLVASCADWPAAWIAFNVLAQDIVRQVQNH